MNADLIKKLAIQAGYTEDSFGIGHWDMLECKKFAELIVKECVRVAELQKQDLDDVKLSSADEEYYMAYNTGVLAAAIHIEGYFGIME